LKDPLASHASNVDGTLNLLWASQTAGIRRLIYASSSSVYGDSPRLPKNEKHVGNLLSPYAVTKKVCELYADVFHRCYGLETVGLRYFNVFGPRQSPNGPYAAVIPRWINSLLNGDPVTIFGDGKTSRDFCYVHNVVQANLLAASAPFSYKNSLVLNVAFHERTTLNQLFALIQNKLVAQGNKSSITQPSYESFRSGDIRHSLADISLAAKTIGYCPRYSVSQGLEECLDWYIQNAKLYAADN
jgi:UDP-N-acetylglucosamine 4-epimerase